MIITLLMSLEGASPEVSRLVNVEDHMHLGDFSTLIDAAFGFSGTTNHVYISTAEGKRTLYTASPGADEKDETTLSVAEINGEMTYVYDPAANWTIRLEILGTSDMDSPAPLLVDAQGPDVIEACGGPEMMTAFHREARRLAAGLEPDMRVSPLLLSFMPVMSPEHLIERLSTADHSTVAERMAFTSEDFFAPEEIDFTTDPRTPDIAEDFDAFLESRPDLQQIISLDPSPERNPSVISAISEFFAEHIPDDLSGPTPPDLSDGPVDDLYPFTGVVDALLAFLEHCEEGAQLTQHHMLLPAHVRAVAGALGLDLGPGNHSETAVGPVHALRVFLEWADYLEVEDSLLHTTVMGQEIGAHPPSLLACFMDDFREFYAFGYEEDWQQNLRWAATAAGLQASSGPAAPPSDPLLLVNLFIAFGIFEPGSTPTKPVLSATGRDALSALLNRYS